MQSIKQIFKTGYGPSSSHTIGPVKAAEIFLHKNPESDHYSVELFGSLAATGKGHNTDVAVKKIFHSKSIEIVWNPDESLPDHPNGMIFKAFKNPNVLQNQWVVYSIGGGDLKDVKGFINNEKIYKHTHLSEIMAFCNEQGIHFWEYVEQMEGEKIWDYLRNAWQIMVDSIKEGLDKEGVLPGRIKLPRKAHSYYVKSLRSKGEIKESGLLFAYALAVSEQNADNGKIVTAPTCGSSGVLPSILYYLQREEYIFESQILRALATAGLIGNLVKRNGSISGAEVGCQGEIGTACAMAAGAAAQILGGSLRQIEYAAEMGFEHNLGLTCDPIGGYVQIPCIERNAIASRKALDCAIYALFSDGGHKISFDKAVETMVETGKDIQSAYRETGKGGLAKKWDLFN